MPLQQIDDKLAQMVKNRRCNEEAVRQQVDTKQERNETVLIYVKLLDEGVDVWRPVGAHRIEENMYQILPLAEDDLLDEVWEFPAGTIVAVEELDLSGGSCLVATRAIPSKSPTSSKV